MSSSSSPDEQIDDSDNDPDFCPDDPGPSRRFSLFNSSARVSSLIESDSESNCEGDSISNNILQETKKKGKQVCKKRVKDESTWTRNVAKKRRAEGKSYIGLKNKNKCVKEERKTGNDCNCKFKCFQKFDDPGKLELLSVFNNIGNKEKQDIFIGGQMRVKKVERQRSKSGGGSKRSCSCVYSIKIGTTEQRVCKKAFCSLYGISKKRVELIVKNLQDNNPAPSDMRGKHANRPNMIPEHIIHQIDSHIQSFPKRTSHYSRTKNENKYYLNPELNMNKMHKLYLQKYEPDIYAAIQDDQQGKPQVTYDYFCRHFITKYNYSFGKPRSDTCQTCDRLDNLISAEKDAEVLKNLKTEKEVHEKKADYFYMKLKEDIAEVKMSNDQTELLAFDYQQNMPLPHVPSGDVFFKRQLWEYNFCIFVASSGKSYFFMYDETVARKGQNDVVSYIHYFINHYVSTTVTKLFLYSDNCSSQNKNHALAQYLYVISENKKFAKIIHRYPEPGHSFLPCDRSFGLIEKEKRKRERIVLPEEWVALVKNTCRKFEVIPVSQDIILNFSGHFSKLFKKTVFNKRKHKFAIASYRVMEYTEKGVACSISASAGFKDEFTLQKPGVHLTLPAPDSHLYSGSLPLKRAKYLHVIELAKKYVPADCMWFYDGLSYEGEEQPNQSEDSFTDV